MSTQPRVIRWESMKRKALDSYVFHTEKSRASMHPSMYHALFAAAMQNPPEKPLELWEEWREYGRRLIENWDIRRCMKLAEILPECLPAYLRKQRPVCEMDEAGKWVLVFDVTPTHA